MLARVLKVHRQGRVDTLGSLNYINFLKIKKKEKDLMIAKMLRDLKGQFIPL